ncbi:MAG: TlpA family protein disulfide reductase [Alphaproteobacteria bacterium]|nr:TlpA family protein disulfide reductase [Alphaproteobacteria bacterium]
MVTGWWALMVASAASAATGDATPHVENLGDARYHTRLFHAAPAVAWLQAHLDDDDDAVASIWLAWLNALAAAPDAADRRIVAAQVAAWASRPGAPEGARAVHAMALQLAELGPSTWSGSPDANATPASCAAAWALLDPVPEAPLDRWYTLWARAELAEACAWAVPEDEQAALALSGQVGPFRQAWYALRGGVDVDVAALLADDLDAQPWDLGTLTWVVRDRPEGPATDAAVDLLLARARAVADDATVQSPSVLDGAARVLEAGGDDATARRVRERLAVVDPRNLSNTARLAPPREHEVRPPEPDTILDPEARLAALRRALPPRRDAWARGQHLRALAETYEALGEPQKALVTLDRWWRVSPTLSANIDFADAAVDHGARLRHGLRAATIAVDLTQDTRLGHVGLDAASEAIDHRVFRARAYAARSRVQDALGHPDLAAQDLRRALVDTPEDGALRVRLGLLLQATDPTDARDALATGLALGGTGDTAQDDPARAALDTALAATGTWAPDGAWGYVQAARAALDVPDAPVGPPAPSPPLPAFTVTLDGEEVALSAIEGPVVLDVWATWCGPCKDSLPHLDTLARRHGDRVRFIAVSVDATQALVDTYLQQVGTPAFEVAWAGEGLMKTLGLDGIPHTYVLDADHAVVASISGWGAGNTRIEEALERMGIR